MANTKEINGFDKDFLRLFHQFECIAICLTLDQRVVALTPSAKKVFAAKENILNKPVASLFEQFGFKISLSRGKKEPLIRITDDGIANNLSNAKKLNKLCWRIEPKNDSNGKLAGFIIYAKEQTDIEYLAQVYKKIIGQNIAEPASIKEYVDGIRGYLEKEALRLKLEEAKLQKTKLQELERFSIIAGQVAHNIRSPLASLLMVVESCKSIPEPERITLREVAIDISDIANNLSSYKKGRSEIHIETAVPQHTLHTLVSLALSEVLSKKRDQYKNLRVKFNYSFNSDNSLVFIKLDPSSFSRIISNVINNAVDAFEGKEGTVDLKLNSDSENVKVIIQDNGKGIPPEIVNKITNNITVTSSKKDGGGIGYGQIRDILQSSRGKLSIESNVGVGTKITLTFPRAESPEWIAKQIKLHQYDTVVILDDDLSIHGAWKTLFSPYPNIKLLHFKTGEEAINHINSFPEKNKILLLADYELAGQKLSGLQVIELTSMEQHSILVTNHYGKQNVCDAATKVGVKILPKQFASYTPIKMEEEKEINENVTTYSKKVDFVIIDDNQIFADSLADFFKNKGAVVDKYYSPKHFLENLLRYAKDTKICMDNDFQSKISGIDLAKQLYKLGYTNLYLFSGKNFKNRGIPSYLKVLLKGDLEALDKLV